MLGIKGVLIDFGDTLAYIDKKEDQRYREEIRSILTKHGCELPFERVSQALDDNYRGSTKGEVKTLQEFWTLFLGKLSVPQKPKLIEKLVEVRRRRYVATTFRLYDAAIEVLHNLKQKYRLALVSNCAIGLSDVLEALGLNCFFEAVILSYQVGVLKPDRRIYQEALGKLRLEPEECVFISDEIGDLEGAKEVGLKTVLVRQGERTTHKARDPNFEPDFQFNSISEIIEFL